MSKKIEKSRQNSARQGSYPLRVPATASALALILGLSGTAYGQDQTAAQQTNQPDGSQASRGNEPVETVLVTGRRRALEDATDRKKEAESIIDSVVADEAGMLPDNSVTEVLQRVSGVAIVRYGSLDDPDHFSGEGTGVQVRGLSGVASRLNGREIFSASGGRALSWSDVTPELMSAVDVYKSATADLIEGGTGGQIDLRTKMPFDFTKRTVQAALDGNYGDLRKETKPGGSLLFSDRYQTGIGEFGALVDVAYNQYSANSDFFRMEPYYRTLVDGQSRYIPGGYDYGDRNFDRTRKGLYVGLQWAPTESLLISQTAFVSSYTDLNLESSLFVTSKDLSVDPATSVFDSNGVLQKSSDVFLRDNSSFARSNGVINVGGNTGVSRGTSITRDYATSFAWRPEGNWSIKGAFQVVNSFSARDDYNVFPGVPFPGSFGLDITGTLPQVTVPASLTTTLTDPSAYEWQATMDHSARNRGTLYAANLDFEYNFEGERFFRSVGFGARYAERSERDNNNSYNWIALGRGWNGSPQMHFSDARSGDVERRVLDDFFRGEANLPGNTLMPSYAMASRYDLLGDHQFYGGGLPPNPVGFLPFDLSRSTLNDGALYGQLRFDGGESKLLGMSYKGNFGTRVVRVDSEGSGFFHQNAGAFIRNGVVNVIDTYENPRSGGRTFTRLLPSLNLTMLPAETVQLRLGYNITLDQPSFLALRASGELGVRTNGSGTPNWDGFTTESGNPNLRPMISHNTDFSAEWYPSRSTTAHLSLFHKSIDNWIVFGSVNQLVPVHYILPTDQTVIELAQASNYSNATQAAKIKGVEVGGRKFFDRLPAPFDGLGVEANYTYIDSKNPGDQYVDINGVTHFDAPVQGLSRNNYNITGMYERGPLSVRLAYSWRSQYLMSTNANGTNGDYNFYSAPGVSTFTDINLPVYSDSYGQLDFGTTYRPTANLAFSLELSNLTNEIAKTLQGGYPNGAKYPRSWFMSDRRANLAVRFNF